MKGLAEVKGLTAKVPRIRARKARCHYGTEIETPYEAREPGDDGHSPRCGKRNPYDGRHYVKTMRWFLCKVR